MERERVTVQEAARRLGITESAVRKRAARGQIRSDKVTEGKRERLYIYLDSEVDRVPEPFRDRYMTSLEDRVRTLEDEVFRQQAIILSMSQSLQALTGASEAPEMPSQAAEGSEPHPTPEESQEDKEKPSLVSKVVENASTSLLTQAVTVLGGSALAAGGAALISLVKGIEFGGTTFNWIVGIAFVVSMFLIFLLTPFSKP